VRKIRRNVIRRTDAAPMSRDSFKSGRDQPVKPQLVGSSKKDENAGNMTGRRVSSPLKVCLHETQNFGHKQGDQIGRLFALVRFLKITELTHIFVPLIFLSINYVLNLTKTGWATCWAIFSQTHLATLAIRHKILVLRPK
jgi:hypothetical protein